MVEVDIEGGMWGVEVDVSSNPSQYDCIALYSDKDESEVM